MGRPFLFQEEKPDTTITTMKDKKLPLLFLLGELSEETKHAFFDPVQETLSIVELPELGCQTECISSGHGWLLLLSRETSSIFFFNPLTRQRIDLPYLNSIINAAAFSAPPTSPNCIVFAIKRSYDKFHIDALCLGQERVWTRYAFNNIGTSEFGIIVQAIFSNNILYLVDSRGRTGNFNFSNANWKIISDKKFKDFCISYLVECNGEVFGLKRQNYGVVDRVYKLKFEDGVSSWEVVKDNGDVTVFFGPYGSCAFTGLNDKLKKKFFVARDDPQSKCVIYNVDGGDYKKKTTLMFDATPFNWWYAPIWIERPASS